MGCKSHVDGWGAAEEFSKCYLSENNPAWTDSSSVVIKADHGSDTDSRTHSLVSESSLRMAVSRERLQGIPHGIYRQRFEAVVP